MEAASRAIRSRKVPESRPAEMGRTSPNRTRSNQARPAISVVVINAAPVRQADQGGPGGFDAFRQAAEQMRAPIAGEDFRDWSDRLRDVEEMVDDPELRTEAARIRQRARDVRRELKRHSVEPNWDLIRIEVSEPLVELRDRVAEELLRRTNKDALIPLDRDPAPPKYSEQTRRYYERLGSGE